MKNIGNCTQCRGRETAEERCVCSCPLPSSRLLELMQGRSWGGLGGSGKSAETVPPPAGTNSWRVCLVCLPGWQGTLGTTVAHEVGVGRVGLRISQVVLAQRPSGLLRAAPMLAEQRGQETEEVDGRGGDLEFRLGLLQSQGGTGAPKPGWP